MALPQLLDLRTSDKETPRSFFWIWYIRIIQTVLTLIILAIAAANIASFNNISCSIPGKLAWQLACAVLSFIVLVYFLFSTGPTRLLKTLPWLLLGQIVLDFVLWIFWLAAAATSRLNCNDQCKACDYPGYVDFDGLYCTCGVLDYGWIYKRDASPGSSANPSAFSGGLEKRRRRSSGTAGTRGAKTGIDAILVILFFATLCASLFSLFKHIQAQRRNQSNAAPGGTTGGATTITQEPKHEENGVNASSAPVMQQQQQPPYNPAGQQQQQQQPPMQQQPNGHYPPAQPQQPAQPFPQQQGQYSYSHSYPSQPINEYGGGSGPQASFSGPEPQTQQYGYAPSEMMGHGGEAPKREETVSPELASTNGGTLTASSHPPNSQ